MQEETTTTVKIVEHQDDKLIVKYEAIEQAFRRRPEAKELPVIAIVIGGKQGDGKSFLLNLFLSYLQYTEDNDGEVGKYSLIIKTFCIQE